MFDLGIHIIAQVELFKKKNFFYPRIVSCKLRITPLWLGEVIRQMTTGELRVNKDCHYSLESILVVEERRGEACQAKLIGPVILESPKHLAVLRHSADQVLATCEGTALLLYITMEKLTAWFTL